MKILNLAKCHFSDIASETHVKTKEIRKLKKDLKSVKNSFNTEIHPVMVENTRKPASIGDIQKIKQIYLTQNNLLESLKKNTNQKKHIINANLTNHNKSKPKKLDSFEKDIDALATKIEEKTRQCLAEKIVRITSKTSVSGADKANHLYDLIELKNNLSNDSTLSKLISNKQKNSIIKEIKKIKSILKTIDEEQAMKESTTHTDAETKAQRAWERKNGIDMGGMVK